MKINPLHCIDFYKAGHRQQYPAGTELVVSNFTPRYNRHANVPNKGSIVFFGLQYFIMEFLQEGFQRGFFEIRKDDIVSDYKERMDFALGPDAVPVDHIEALHELGYLPIEIKAVPEGSRVKVGSPCLTIHNTLPEFFWLTNYLETVLSAYLWMPCTSATTAAAYRNILESYADKTGAPKEFVDFQAHDFSFRGQSSLQSAIVSGAAHLVFFKGTDTVPAIDFMEQFYYADCTKELIGCSVPATEHSVMCMGGALEEEEIATFERLMDIYPAGIVSIVSDTWDFWTVIGEYSKILKDKIMKREGKVVFRPDSGNPANILCGQEIGIIADNKEITQFDINDFGHKGLWNFKHRGKYYAIDVERDGYDYHGSEEPKAEAKGAVEVLWDIFGGTITATGHKLLDSHVGLIYGDSITPAIATEILDRLEKKGFASSNVVFGVGSYTYQYVTRDTWGWAIKATYGVVNGQPKNIFKDPKTDDGGKKSHKGLLCLNQDGSVTQECSWEVFNGEENHLKTVFKDGKRIKEYTLQEVRDNAKVESA